MVLLLPTFLPLCQPLPGFMLNTPAQLFSTVPNYRISPPSPSSSFLNSPPPHPAAGQVGLLLAHLSHKQGAASAGNGDEHWDTSCTAPASAGDSENAAPGPRPGPALGSRPGDRRAVRSGYRLRRPAPRLPSGRPEPGPKDQPPPRLLFPQQPGTKPPRVR